MSTTWTLIPWNELTTSIDTLQAIDNNKETMTYLDLYQQLSELNSDELTQTVSIYAVSYTHLTLPTTPNV